MSAYVRFTENNGYMIKVRSIIRKGLIRYTVRKLYNGRFESDWDNEKTIFDLCGANDFGGRVVHKIGDTLVVDIYQEDILGGV
jgi:hypothetical protein